MSRYIDADKLKQHYSFHKNAEFSDLGNKRCREMEKHFKKDKVL